MRRDPIPQLRVRNSTCWVNQLPQHGLEMPRTAIVRDRGHVGRANTGQSQIASLGMQHITGINCIWRVYHEYRKLTIEHVDCEQKFLLATNTKCGLGSILSAQQFIPSSPVISFVFKKDQQNCVPCILDLPSLRSIQDTWEHYHFLLQYGRCEKGRQAGASDWKEGGKRDQGETNSAVERASGMAAR